MRNKRTKACQSVPPAASTGSRRSQVRSPPNGAAIRGVLHDRKMPGDVRGRSRGGGSRALRSTPFYLDGNHRLIVERVLAFGKFLDCLKQGCDYTLRGLLRASSNHALHALAPEHLPSLVAGIQNAVAEEHEHVSGPGAEAELFVLGVVEQAQRQPRRFVDLHI